MSRIANMIEDLRETTIARNIGIPHDQARNGFPIQSNVVTDYPQFEHLIASYYSHHYKLTYPGCALPWSECLDRAKHVLEQEFQRRHRGDLVSCYRGAVAGLDGGVRAILDILAESIKAQAVQRYVREVFDRYVSPVERSDKVAIIREFFAECGRYLSPTIDQSDPSRYARDYTSIVNAYVMSLQEVSSIFRRL